jgi:hypothetical protein
MYLLGLPDPAVRYPETSLTIYQSTWHNVLEDLNPQEYRCDVNSRNATVNLVKYNVLHILTLVHKSVSTKICT